MNVEIGTEAAQFPEMKYITGIFLAVYEARVLEQTSLSSPILVVTTLFFSRTIIAVVLSTTF